MLLVLLSFRTDEPLRRKVVVVVILVLALGFVFVDGRNKDENVEEATGPVADADDEDVGSPLVCCSLSSIDKEENEEDGWWW